MRDRTSMSRNTLHRPMVLFGAAALLVAGLFTFVPAANAGFAAPVKYGTQFSSQGVAIGDFNGDGDNDMAVNNAANNTVSVLISNGDGTFAPKVDYPTDSQPYAIAMGDFTGDGLPDLATANRGDNNNVSVLLNDGDGTFGPKTDYPAGDNPEGIAVGKLNGDGFNDIVVANRDSDNISVFLGGLSGSFAPATNYTVGDGPRSVSIGNLNESGTPDLVVTLNNTDDVAVLLDNGSGGYQTPVLYGGGPSPGDSAIGDFSGDGILDFATSNMGTNNVTVHPGVGDGTFTSLPSFATPSIPYSIATGDLNADGNLDLVTPNFADDNVSVFLGNGNNTFGASTEYLAGDSPWTAEIGNLDNDGNPDLAVPLWHETNVAVLMNQAPDATSSPASVAFGNTPMGQTSSAVTVNIDNDSGGDPLVATEIYADGEDFSVDRENCSAGPTPFDGSCEVLLVFSPAALGARSGDLVIEYAGSADSPLRVPLTGTGVDVTPPNTVIDSGPSGTIAANSAKFTFHGDPASDTAKIMCKLDSAAFADCSSPKTFSNLADGSHTVQFRAQDAAGNQDQTPATRTFKVAVPKPTAKISKVTVKGPAKAKKGKKPAYTVRVTNSGGAVASRVKLKVSGKGVKLSKVIGSISAGKTRSLKIKLKFRKPGKVKATFKVTSSNAGTRSARKTVKVRK